MEGSRFNIFVELDDNNFLLYNTLSRASSIIPRSLVGKFGWDLEGSKKGLFRSLIGTGPGERQQLPALSEFPKNLLEVMKRNGFIVDNKIEDFHNLDSFLEIGYNPDIFYPVIAYTSKCDMACSYCFQEGVNRNETQNEETIAKTIDWINEYINNKDPFRGINLGLFGGEPLLDANLGERFVREVSSICRTRNMSFEFGVTTNGTHLNKRLIQRWVNVGLTYVRITLDGPKHIHDARRVKLSGRGTYDLILGNIINIADIEGLRIGVEVNIDMQNAYVLDGLLDDIEKFGLKYRIEITPEQTLETMASTCGGVTQEDTHHCRKYCLEGNELTNAFSYVIDRLMERGFRLPEFVGVYYPCIFVQKHHLVIDWKGNMYKCSFTMGDTQMCVGTIRDGLNKINDEMLGATKVVEYCKDRECAYIPICGGGCRYESLNKTGTFLEPNCKADMIDVISKKTLRAFFA